MGSRPAELLNGRRRLRALTKAPALHPSHAQMYMLLIILLMLSQDSAFAQNIHSITLQVRGAARQGRICCLSGHRGTPAPAKRAALLGHSMLSCLLHDCFHASSSCLS